MSICICSDCVRNYAQIYQTLKNDSSHSLYLSQNMHIVWFGCFVEKFQNVCNLTGLAWNLIPWAEESNTILQLNESAKVRFICRNCDNVWTSMFGAITFNVFQGSTYILGYKLLGQKCSKCSSSEFEYPIWYPEEVERVLENVVRQILHMEIQQKSNKPGNPKGSHKQESCQACAQKICRHCRSRFNSENLSLEECFEGEREEEENDDDDEEEEEEEEDEEMEKEIGKTMPLTSDYESECDFGSSCENSFFKRSLSMPAKTVVSAFSPTFFCET